MHHKVYIREVHTRWLNLTSVILYQVKLCLPEQRFLEGFSCTQFLREEIKSVATLCFNIHKFTLCGITYHVYTIIK